MLQALLAAADPLDRIERGAPASVYEPLAAAILATLRSGGDVRRVVLLLNEQAMGDLAGGALSLNTVVAFAEAAVDWWANAESRWQPSLAM